MAHITRVEYGDSGQRPRDATGCIVSNGVLGICSDSAKVFVNRARGTSAVARSPALVHQMGT